MTTMTASLTKYSLHLIPHEIGELGQKPFKFQNIPLTINALRMPKLKKKLSKPNCAPHIKRLENAET